MVVVFFYVNLLILGTCSGEPAGKSSLHGATTPVGDRPKERLGGGQLTPFMLPYRSDPERHCRCHGNAMDFAGACTFPQGQIGYFAKECLWSSWLYFFLSFKSEVFNVSNSAESWDGRRVFGPMRKRTV